MAGSLILLAPLTIGLLGTLVIEALLSPRPRPFWQRGVAANSMHLGNWLLLFGLFACILQRPWFAVVVVLALQMVVVQSSNTKSRTLNEPFICHDFEYFWDAILHPRLYVPFFGIRLAIAASSAGAAAIAGFLYWEPSLVNQWGGQALMLSGISLATLGALLIGAGWQMLPRITLNPMTDLERLGLFASLWAYGLALLRSTPPTPEASPFFASTQPTSTAENSPHRPHVVLVQSESFFDPRPLFPGINDDLLHHFDTTCAEALQSGEVNVPAWGANTVRTECAVLTGLPPEQWGARQFNPYHTVARQPLPSIAHAFKAQGYRTICIHPYPASFYRRHKVMPQLGFDSFIDISDFKSDDKNGQYVGDGALAQKVGRLLEDDDNRPLFIFVITMENHGPLHLEAPTQRMQATALPAAPWPLPAHLRDLTVYLHHLAEADRMLATVKSSLVSSARPGLLGWYGDHVPILPSAYQAFSPPSGKTPYLIWSTQPRSATQMPTQAHSLEANELGVQLFKQAIERDISGNVIKAEPEHQEQE
ncbi:MAG: LTA synthase family protein [Pseudomonadota bacterium]